MTHFDIPAPIDIPYSDYNDSLSARIKESSKRRGLSIPFFIYRKIKNTILYRASYFCPFNSLRIKMHRWRGVNIGEHVWIDKQCSIDNAYPELVYIEDYAAVNQGSTIIAHTNTRSHFMGVVHCSASPVVVRHHSLVSINCILLPGVEIGEYAIVNAGAVVTRKVKPYTIVAGNPAKKVLNFETLLQKYNRV